MQAIRVFSIINGIALFLLSGCSIKPTSIEDRAQLNNTYQSVQAFFDKQDQISGRVTIAEAVARTLKYNLEDRVRQSQYLLENGNLTLAKLEMMPELNVVANHSFRNNEQIQNLIQNGNIVEGQQSYTPKKVNTALAEIRWNILDFGLSYTRAQQQANHVMAMAEQKRKMTQDLIQEATSAYWKAWAAQEMLEEVVEYKKKVIEALNRSRALSANDIGDIQSELDYQQVLIRSLRRVNQLQSQISDARVHLLGLMNVSPKSDFTLAPPNPEILKLPELNVDLQKLDTLALVYRPELREASYEKLIQEKGVRLAVLNMLPGITFDFGYNYTDNEFMKNRKWLSGDYNVSWNLLRGLIRGPADIKVAEQNVEFQKLKQAAMTMAVLTQVRIAHYAYALASEDYAYAEEDAKVTEELFQFAKKLEEAHQGNEQITIRRGIERLDATFDRQVAFAKAQESLARLYQSVGIDTVLDEDRALPLSDLSKKIEEIFIAQSQGNFNTIVTERYAKLMPLLNAQGTLADASLTAELQQLSKQPKLSALTADQMKAIDAKKVVTVELLPGQKPVASSSTVVNLPPEGAVDGISETGIQPVLEMSSDLAGSGNLSKVSK